MTIIQATDGEGNTTMMMSDFTTTSSKNPVTPHPMDIDEKSHNMGSNNEYNHHESSYSCLSPPPPPQGRRYEDAERTVTSKNAFSNDLLVFPSLSTSNLKMRNSQSHSRTPTFKLQPKRGGLPCLNEEYFK
jgi:hypothetical protein